MSKTLKIIIGIVIVLLLSVAISFLEGELKRWVIIGGTIIITVIYLKFFRKSDQNNS